MPFAKRNNAPKVTAGTTDGSTGQNNTTYQKYVDYSRFGEDGRFIACQLMQGDVFAHRLCNFSHPMRAIFTNPRQTFIEALEKKEFRLVTKEPTNRRVSFDNGQMLRSKSSSGSGYPYFVGIVLYEGEHNSCEEYVWMLKALDKIIHAELMWYFENHKKNKNIDDVLLEFDKENDVSVKVDGNCFQSLDNLLMDGGVANVIRGYWIDPYENLTLYANDSVVASLFSPHDDGYSKTAICEFGFPITDKTSEARCQDKLTALASKELDSANEEWGSKVIELLVRELKQGRYVRKDQKFLKRLEEQFEKNENLKGLEIFKDFCDCLNNLKEKRADTQKTMTQFFDKKEKSQNQHGEKEDEDSGSGSEDERKPAPSDKRKRANDDNGGDSSTTVEGEAVDVSINRGSRNTDNNNSGSTSAPERKKKKASVRRNVTVDK